MESFKDYLFNEILKNSNNKFLSLGKNLFKLGKVNAMLLVRIYLITSKKKGIFNLIISNWAKNKLIKNYGIELSSNTKIGIGLNLGHANGIIFGGGVVIGKNVTIYQQVTFGIADVTQKGKLESYPKIGDNCIIYAGAKIFGDIKVGNGTIVGANSVLLCDTEENSVYAGIPARRIK